MHEVSHAERPTSDNNAIGTHQQRPSTQGQEDKEFNLRQAKKKLRSLQSRQVSHSELSATPEVQHELPKQSNKFEGKSLSSILMVELYAGSARLSKACQQVGVRSVAVDKTTQRSQGNRTFVCDVTNEADLCMLKSFLSAEGDNLAWLHIAPACGTASRAREKPNRTLEKAGYRVPKPCRSDQYPLGLPNLQGLDKTRTEAANEVYKVTAELVRMVPKLGVVCTIENPSNSLFWKVPYIADMICDLGGYDLVFDSCCHGGSRKKSTKFWCTHDWFLGLAATCPGNDSHFHKSWAPTVVDGVVQYPTAEEAAYPELLCQRLAESFRAALLDLGVVDVDNFETQQQVEQTPMHRLIMGALPRGKKYKPL